MKYQKHHNIKRDYKFQSNKSRLIGKFFDGWHNINYFKRSDTIRGGTVVAWEPQKCTECVINSQG